MKRFIITIAVLAWSTQGCAQPTGQDGLRPRRQAAQADRAGRAEEAPPPTPNVDLPRYPAISPDGRWVTFTWRGDVWKAPSEGGHAQRLTTHPGDDLRSAFSRDGGRIAFESDRNGFQNIYLMNADGTDVRQVTDVDVACELTGFGVDDEGREVITFAASLEGDPYRSMRPYMIAVGGGEIRRVHDAFGDDPQVSLDGRRVAFTRGGAGWSRRHYRGPDRRNTWVFNRDNRTFTQLTHWEGNDGRAKWVGPDGLIFMSDRQDDTVNLYRMGAERGDRNVARLTHLVDNDVTAFDVSADGETVVFTAWDTLYRLDLTERDPQPKTLPITANEDERDNYEVKSIDRSVSEAALSPDGKAMAFVAYGEVYVRSVEEKSPTVAVTRDPWRQKDVAWSPDGLKLYFVDDRDGTESIFAATVALTRAEIQEEFEKATKPPKPEEKPAEEEKAEEPADDDDAGNGVDEGKGKDAEADAADEKQEKKDEEGKADEKKKKEEELPKELKPERWQDAVKFNVAPVVQSEHNDRAPSPSPDGKSLAFRRGRGDLMILDLESGETRTPAAGWDTGLNWRWSPDSRHIAYEQSNMDFNADIWIVPADGSHPAVNVTRHPDNDGNPRWSADGKILSFISERVNEELDVWMAYLDRDLEALTPKEREKYYKDAVEAAKKRKPLKVKKPGGDKPEGGATKDDAKDGGAKKNSERDAAAAKTEDEKQEEKSDEKKDDRADEKEDDAKDGKKKDEEPPFTVDELQDAYLRLRRVTTWNGSESNNEMTPGGDRYVFSGEYGESGLYSIKWDGTDHKKLTGPGSVQGVSLTGDKVVFVASGRAGTVGPEGGKVENIDLEDKIRIDLREQSNQKFLEAARILGEQFYHPTMKDLDWAALTKRYHALACDAHTADEFNHVAARFIGELNASHLGVRAPEGGTPNAQAMGRLGIERRRIVTDAAAGFEVTKVFPRGPADVGPMALKAGDVITAVELAAFGPDDTLEGRLRGRVGIETIVTLRRTLEGGEAKELNVLITPVGSGAERQLKYDAWRLDNAALVEEWSGGRIGYIHIQAMSQPSLDVFERDLHAAASGKAGLIIDVRNNGGGWTTDRLLSSIMASPHAYTVPRGAPQEPGHYPQDRLFIQRYALPINMLCNEKSFSNAEIISHAFKTLKRGTLVGQETHGAVISTGGTTLIDGTSVRLPFRGWFLPDGTDMENHGARPHVVIEQTPEAESRNDDEQLRAAVDDLFKRL